MLITIIAVGKLEQKFKEIFDIYNKKINLIAKLNIVEIKEIAIDNIDLKIKKETKLILEKIPKSSNVFLFSLKGKMFSSKELSTFFETNSNLTFIIGGSNGVDEAKFDKKICFSKLTFPHQLFRIMAVEQIYRSLTIIKNIKYHK
ncbi:23S rRNA (pseudouridine(1915)-N(3))-methyltransferase RlmH [[Mycoplasma] collis]|uniref:23S rRNA (pseudouridine(1915)-N(3))-methyltransferase RlmH n=1 Tax=[Mycoplasma] collis TaxID=2127 RepID=UPI00051C09C8|nr:23S rRNA (pseudouridine(1915)-N(3))-methyltransferase RlmH [[Mycoplasma] collis]